MLVTTNALTKRYGSSMALEACSLHVSQGEIFGLLGHNGAGKTTLLRLLLGYITPSSGMACVDGINCATQSLAVRSRTAYLPGEARIFRRMKGHAVLDFFSGLRKECCRLRAKQIADRLELDCNRQVARMSTGMRQKLALAIVLSTDAPLVILDEPTANLDPTARSEVLKMVMESRALGRTVIFSSHVLSEVESTCDRVVILRSGNVVHEQSIESMKRSHLITARLTGSMGKVPPHLEKSVSICSANAVDDTSRVTIESSGSLKEMLGWLAELPLEEIHIEPVGLSSVYDQYT